MKNEKKKGSLGKGNQAAKIVSNRMQEDPERGREATLQGRGGINVLAGGQGCTDPQQIWGRTSNNVLPGNPLWKRKGDGTTSDYLEEKKGLYLD